MLLPMKHSKVMITEPELTYPTLLSLLFSNLFSKSAVAGIRQKRRCKDFIPLCTYNNQHVQIKKVLRFPPCDETGVSFNSVKHVFTYAHVTNSDH